MMLVVHQCSLLLLLLGCQQRVLLHVHLVGGVGCCTSHMGSAHATAARLRDQAKGQRWFIKKHK